MGLLDRHEYQWDYWSKLETIRDPASRLSKAAKIQAILRTLAPVPPAGRAAILDVGCSTGIILGALARAYGTALAVGIDIDRTALLIGKQDACSEPLLQADALHMPFKDRIFDIVICAQVYEHVPDWRKLLREISRVLRFGGLCFFSGPNKWWPIETHYNLPALSMLPRTVANSYVRLLRKGECYYENAVSWRELRLNMKEAGFEVLDYTWRLIEAPDRFGISGWLPRFASVVLRLMPPAWRPAVTYVSPNFNVVLKKIVP